MFNSGKKQTDIMDALVKKSNYDFTGYSATDKQKQQDYINELFQSADSARKKSLAFLSPEQKVGIEDAKQVILGKVGHSKITLAGDTQEQDAFDVYNKVLNKAVAGSNMTHDEIVGYANDLFKNTSYTVPGRIWGTNTKEEPTGQMMAEKSTAFAESNADLEKQYGRNIVQQAREALGGNPYPAAINEAIQRLIRKNSAKPATNIPPVVIPARIEQRAE